MPETTENCCANNDEGLNGKYDLAVIGAGSAGFSAAIKGAEQGAQVALIGHGAIGGTCVNVGCVPSKTLIRAAETLHHANAARRFTGINASASITDWQGLIAQKDSLVDDMRLAKYVDLLPAYNGLAYLEGRAFLTEDGVTVNGKRIDADKIVITTGARPAVPDIQGIEDVPYLTSTEALDLDQLPGSFLVIGGGYIGCELAQFFARTGVDITIVCRSRLLPDAEPEISDGLTNYFGDEGIRVFSGVTYKSISQVEGQVQLDISGPSGTSALQADKVLVTTGRTPNSDGLGLEDIGIELLPNGGINIDDRMRTNRSGVYAAGDVTGSDQFVYMAAYGARIAAENALNGDDRQYDNNAMPSVVFTDPQVASVGLTERKAGDIGIDVRTSVLPLEHLPRALAARDTRGMIKLVAEAETNRVLGAHILAPEGADSIQTAVLAIKHNLTVSDLAETVFPYLTTVEGLKLAAQAFDRDVAKLSCCAG